MTVENIASKSSDVCQTWYDSKDSISGVYVTRGNTGTLVMRSGISNHRLIAYFVQQHFCQKLSKSVEVCWSYSVLHQCPFL